MDDAEFQVQKTRVLALIEKWVKPIGLGWWHITFKYVRDSFLVSPEDHEANWQCVMKCNAKWQYLDAAISISMPAIVDLDDDDLEKYFIHELCHIPVNELRQVNEDDCLMHEERVVTTLANAFVWLAESLKTSPPSTTDGSE